MKGESPHLCILQMENRVLQIAKAGSVINDVYCLNNTQNVSCLPWVLWCHFEQICCWNFSDFLLIYLFWLLPFSITPLSVFMSTGRSICFIFLRYISCSDPCLTFVFWTLQVFCSFCALVMFLYFSDLPLFLSALLLLWTFLPGNVCAYYSVYRLLSCWKPLHWQHVHMYLILSFFAWLFYLTLFRSRRPKCLTM